MLGKPNIKPCATCDEGLKSDNKAHLQGILHNKVSFRALELPHYFYKNTYRYIYLKV